MATRPMPSASRPQIAAPVLANVSGDPADTAFDDLAPEALAAPEYPPGAVDVVTDDEFEPSVLPAVTNVVDVVVVDDVVLVDDGIDVDVEGAAVVLGAVVAGAMVLDVVVPPSTEVVVSAGGSVVDVVVSTAAHPLDWS